MYSLQPSEHDRVRPLFEALDHHLSAAAILEGAAPGVVYVDDLARPQAAFTWTQHRFFLVGSERNGAFNEGVRRLFLDEIDPLARQARMEMLELKYAPASWESALPGILAGKRTLQVRRQFYRYMAPAEGRLVPAPDGFTLRFIDAALLRERHLQNLGALELELCSERPTVREFLDKSFGVAGLHGDEIAGWCTSEYNCRDRCEVGIGTLESYQRRGLATAMASAFVRHAFARGVSHIGWHCFARNVASAATALKAGFELVCDEPICLAWF
jgi:GNAT superfamily N-acetyltransferase